MRSILSIENITMAFGGLLALKDVCIGVDPDRLLSVIGPNGSGKTTLFNVITGIYLPTSGQVTFLDQDITGLKPYTIAAKGIARTFQNINLFGSMTVVQNVMVGRHPVTREGVTEAVFRNARFYAEERATYDKALELVDFVGLSSKSNELAKNLPYGEQKRLEIARALASDPKLILLDEPMAGLNPREKSEVCELINAVHRRGITVILIEHDMRVVMGISDRVVVLDHGEKIADGTPDEIRMDPQVIEAYLGKGAEKILNDAQRTRRGD